MKRFITLLFFTLILIPLLGRGVCAQKKSGIHIRGRVTDASSGTPLSFANVSIAATSRGTATNENGQFVLSIDSLPIRISISYVGYETVKRQVQNKPTDSLVVRLEEKPVTMEGLVIKSNTGISYVQKSRNKTKKLWKNKTSFTHGVRGFYRQKTKFFPVNKKPKPTTDTIYTEYVEMFCNSFTSPFGIRKWSIEQARYARAKKPKNRIYSKNFSALTRKWFRVPPLRSTEETKVLQPFHSNAEEYFSFDIAGHVKQKGRRLVKITYEPKRDLEKPVFSGHLFIDAETYALHHYEGTAHSSEGFFLNVPIGEVENMSFHFSISFRSLGDPSVTVVDRVHLDETYVHRVGDVRRRYRTNSRFFVYDYNPTETFGTSRIEDDYAAIDSVDYDPQFWRDNPVLARTPVDKAVIRSFEKTGGFGRLVEEQTNSD